MSINIEVSSHRYYITLSGYNENEIDSLQYHRPLGNQTGLYMSNTNNCYIICNFFKPRKINCFIYDSKSTTISSSYYNNVSSDSVKGVKIYYQQNGENWKEHSTIQTITSGQTNTILINLDNITAIKFSKDTQFSFKYLVFL
jgi:hypothetical protein